MLPPRISYTSSPNSPIEMAKSLPGGPGVLAIGAAAGLSWAVLRAARAAWTRMQEDRLMRQVGPNENAANGTIY